MKNEKIRGKKSSKHPGTASHPTPGKDRRR